MKTIAFFTVVFCCFFSMKLIATNGSSRDTIKQKLSADAKASSTESLLTIKLKNSSSKPIANCKLTLKHQDGKQLFSGVTNNFGEVRFLLPIGAKYSLDIGKTKDFRTINVTNRPNVSINMDFTYSDVLENVNDEPSSIDYSSFQTVDASARSKPTQNQMDLSLKVYDNNNKTVANVTVKMVCEKTKTVYTGKTNTFGEARLLLPIDALYQIGVEEADNIDNLTVPNIPGLRATKGVYYQPTSVTEEVKKDTIFQNVSIKQKPTSSRVLVEIEIKDMNDMPLADEFIVLTSKKQKKSYKAITDKEGKTNLLIPKNDSYSVSFEYHANYDSLFFPASTSFETEHLKFNYLGSKAIKKRLLEKKKEIAMRDSVYKLMRIRDSLDLKNIGRREFVFQFQQGVKRDTIFKKMQQRALEERKEVEKDAKYFEKSGSTVQAVFYRLKNMWKNKLIVTDITGSMSPFWDQVIMWHVLKLVNNEKNKYVFFNDGDGKMDSEKIIGKTGGIYFAQTDKLEDVFQTMVQGVSAGSGGDAPENDIEALLYSLQHKNNFDELILIADNYANIKDISLLYLLKIPVHVVLCGTDYGINEDYLELAYKTKGSVHTIEKDIFDLYQVKEGGFLQAGNVKYKLNKGKFLKVE